MAPLLRPLIQQKWTEMVGHRNDLEVARLERFLFGADRASLQPVRAHLVELQRGACFYCVAQLAESSEVDHFLPWSRHPDDRLDNLVERVTSLNVWQHGDERAPHKPLLLLWTLARLQRGEPRLATFADIERDVGGLLKNFGPPRRSYHPEYPFWHLQSDGLWVIPERSELEHDLEGRTRKNNPPKSVLLRLGAHGGLPEPLDRELRARPDLVNRIVARLLDDSFPPSLHQDLLDAVGMPWVSLTTRPARDAAFRDTILRIYEHRCAVCGYDAMLGSTDLGLEAAHLRWHAAGGTDTEDNGLAVCALHHRALDRGAIGLDDDRRILVSQHVRPGTGAIELLVRFTGQPLQGPQTGCPPPAPPNIAWHRREVFREPARVRGRAHHTALVRRTSPALPPAPAGRMPR